MSRQVLYLAKAVASATEDCETYTPANGKSVRVISMHSEAAFSANSAVKIVWDYSGTPVVLWAAKGSGSLPLAITEDFPAMVGDGTKKIAVCLDNGETGTIFMSGHVILEVGD